MTKKYVDTSGWENKVAAVEIAKKIGISKGVDFAMDTIFKEAAKNLSGPVDNTGKMPVPRITGNLADSLKTLRVTPEVGAVYSDGRVAKYNKVIHDGLNFSGYKRKKRTTSGDANTSKKGKTGQKVRTSGGPRKPRRFLTDPVRIHRTMIKNKMDELVRKEIQKVGRA